MILRGGRLVDLQWAEAWTSAEDSGWSFWVAFFVQLQQAWEQLVKFCDIVEDGKCLVGGGYLMHVHQPDTGSGADEASKRAPGRMVGLAGLHVALLYVSQEVGHCRPLVEQKAHRSAGASHPGSPGSAQVQLPGLCFSGHALLFTTLMASDRALTAAICKAAV